MHTLALHPLMEEACSAQQRRQQQPMRELVHPCKVKCDLQGMATVVD